MNHENIWKNPKRIAKIIPLINQYNWCEINFLPEAEDWSKFETNKSISLNVFFAPHNKEEMKQTDISKHSSEHPN